MAVIQTGEVFMQLVCQFHGMDFYVFTPRVRYAE